MKFVIIGSGNLATHLTPALINAGHTVLQIFNRTASSGQALADKLGCDFTNSTAQLNTTTDAYIFAVSDKAIEPLCNAFKETHNEKFTDKLLIHTAGSVSDAVFKSYTNNYGVLYPLQTFSKQRKLNFGSIPVFYEANNATNTEKIQSIAVSISNSVTYINSQQRKALHLAAVFVCNFTNLMFSIGHKLLSENNISYDVLKPLISETVDKALTNNPVDVQTGPAVRFDENIINSHKQMLNNHQLWQKLYTFASESIFELVNQKKNIEQ